MNSPAFVRASALGALLTLLAGGCSSMRTAGGDAAAPTVTCAIAGPGNVAGDTLSLAAMEAVDQSNVPAPTNGGERLLFAQLYETLIDVDCEGRPRPALARSWTLDATRTRVTLTIRDDAHFWTGAPLTSSDVVAGWRATAPHSGEPGRLARDMVNATTIIDDRTLTVSLPDTAWLVLADRALAVYRPRPSTAPGWPEGSGRYRPTENLVRSDGNYVLLAPQFSADPYLMLRARRTGDARDAIDAGSDVLVTADPAAVSYAASRPGLSVVPLPWTRTYALAGRRSAAGTDAWAAALPDSALARIRASLAHDAVRADARPAPPGGWSNAVASCGLTSGLDNPTTTAIRGSRRVVYRNDDRIAQALAERLVALEGSAVATALSSDDFARVLRLASDVGYVLEMPSAPLSPCRALAAVYSAAPWLARDEGARLLPLIDVREHAIIKRNGVSAAIAWDGTLIFGSPWRRP